MIGVIIQLKLGPLLAHLVSLNKGVVDILKCINIVKLNMHFKNKSAISPTGSNHVLSRPSHDETLLGA